MRYKTIKHHNRILSILDQRLLPHKVVYRKARTAYDVYRAIKDMILRGAPLIGVTAAWGIALEAQRLSGREFRKKLKKAINLIRRARPTARNLFWACARMERLIDQNREDDKILKKRLLLEAEKIEQEDVAACEKIGRYGAPLIHNGDKVMVYCNAGALATAGIGTALGVLYTAKQEGKKFTVYACETRPWLQGARLTTWELNQAGIKTYLLCDNMAGAFMEDIDLVLVGADRIAVNGDVANKIGTKGLAIVARYFNVPLYVAAPVTTFDFRIGSGEEIEIEFRKEEEVKSIAGKLIAPRNIKAINPAFDITPNTLITGIITDRGIIYPPYKNKIKKLSPPR
ncbi:MAG: S-methyl-5-thioribose-1-phosphate isomerase [candidate division WOR-3 bacterium]